MADGRHLKTSNRSIWATVRPIFTKISTVTHMDPVNPTERKEELFVGHWFMHMSLFCIQHLLKNHPLLAGARWHLLANMIKPSMRAAQGWAVQKQLNRSRCSLGARSCGLRKPLLEGCAHWRTWWIWLNLQLYHLKVKGNNVYMFDSAYTCNSAIPLSAADALACHINLPPPTKNPLRCGLSSKICDHLLLI